MWHQEKRDLSGSIGAIMELTGCYGDIDLLKAILCKELLSDNVSELKVNIKKSKSRDNETSHDLIVAISPPYCHVITYRW